MPWTTKALSALLVIGCTAHELGEPPAIEASCEAPYRSYTARPHVIDALLVVSADLDDGNPGLQPPCAVAEGIHGEGPVIPPCTMASPDRPAITSPRPCWWVADDPVLCPGSLGIATTEGVGWARWRCEASCGP
jgi:hypothetical protein